MQRLRFLLRLIARALMPLVWTLVCVAALAASFVLHLQLPIARQVLREIVNQLATDEIRGELVIGRIDELSWKHIVLRNVALFDGTGRRIIVGDRVELLPDLDTLARQLLTRDLRSIHVVRARLIGGTVHLIDDGTGSPTLFTTFDARRPSTSSTSTPPPLVTLESVELQNLTIYGELLGLRGMRAERVNAHGTMNIDDEVEIAIRDAQGKLVQPFGFVGHIDTLSGSISTRKERGVVLNATVHRNAERAQVRVEYKQLSPDTEQALNLLVDAQGLSYDTLQHFGYNWAKPLQGRADGQLRLRGPVEDLELGVDVQTAGGKIALQGSISDQRGVALQFVTDELDPQKLVPNAPSVTLRGKLDLVTTSEAPQPKLHAELAALRYKGISVPAVDIDAVVEEDLVRIERARTKAAGARLSVRGTVTFEGGTDLDIDASFPAIERDPNLSRYIDNVKGALTAKLRVQTPAGTSKRLNITGKLVLDHLEYGSISAARVSLQGSVRGDPSLPTLNVEVRAEQTSVLAYSLGEARFALRGGPRGYDAEGEFQAKGQKTFYFSAKIAANRKGFVVQADPIEFSVGTNTWRGLARDIAVIHGDRVELGLMRLASRSQRLEAQGIVRLHGEDNVTAQLQNFDLAALHALIGARFPFSEGNADASVEIHGDVADPELFLQGAMRGGKAFDISGIDALYSINYKDGHLDLDSEVSVLDRGTLDAKGTADIDASIADPTEMLQRGRYDLALSGTDFDITLIPGTAGKQIEGRASGSLLAKGTFDKPEVTSKLVVKGLRTQELAPVTLGTDLTYKGTTLAGAVTLADAKGALGDVHGSLELEWERVRSDPKLLVQAITSGKWKLAGKTDARRLDDMPFTLPAQWALPVFLGTRFDLQKTEGPTQGSLRFTLKPADTLDYEECGLRLQPELRGLVLVDGGRTRFSFTGNLDDKRVAFGQGDVDIDIDALLREGATKSPGRINVDGTADIDAMENYPWLCKQGKGDLHMTWSAHDLLTNTPSGSVKLTGSYLPRIAVPTGRRKITINSCKKDPIKLALEAKIDAQHLSLSGQTTGCNGGPMQLAADAPLLWQSGAPLPRVDEQRDLRVQLDFQDAELRPLLDRIPGVLSFSALARGRLTAKASARGVDYRGSVTLKNGKLYPIATGQELRNISAALVGNGNWAKIEGLHASGGENGSLKASGGIGFERWSPRRLQLGLLLKNFPLQREGVDLAWLTGGAAISTEIGQDKALTAIKLHTLAISLPSANSRSLQPLEPHPDIALTTDKPAVHPEIPYVLEFFVNGRRRVTIKRNDFDATVVTELAMSYQEPAFRVGGYVEFQRGTFNVFGKDFNLTRGSMHFDGSGELNPEVNMVATYEPGAAGGSPVVVTVTGTLADPHVEFYSESCPGDGAIVMLVSGRCPDQDSFASGDPASDRNAFAAGIVGGILTLGAQRELGGLIPHVSVESTGQGSQARFKAGFDAVPKFMHSLVQRVYVQGAVSTSEEAGLDPTADTGNATLDFLIELYFPHNIVGAGRFAPDNYWGLDVTWEP